MTERFFEGARRSARQAQASAPAAQEQKRLSGSAGGAIPLFDEDPDDRPHGTQWINQTPEPFPRLKVQLGDTTYVAELIPEGAGGAVPVGGSIRYHGASDPPGGVYVVEDGRLLSRDEYPEAFAVMGTAFNTGGETSAQFRIPDSRSRVPVGAGQGAGLTNRARGERGGEEAHTQTDAEMPRHSHDGTTGSDSHDHGDTDSAGSHAHELDLRDVTYSLDPITSDDDAEGSGGNYALSWTETDYPDTTTGGSHSHGISTDTHSHAFSTDNAGKTEPFNIVQPYLASNWAVRVRP